MTIETNPNMRCFRTFQDEHFTDLNLYQYGWEQCTPLKSFGPHTRNCFLFHFVLSGRGTLLANDREYPVQAGQGFLIFPGQITTYVADQTNPWEYVWMEFDGLRVRKSLLLAGLSKNEPIWYAANQEASEQLKTEILRMAHCDLDNISPTQGIGYCWFFLEQLVRSSRQQREDRSSSRLRDFYIREAISFIEQNYQQAISVEEIAAFCRLHRSYLGKIFKESLGKSPQQFLLHYRMAKAEQLLRETEYPIHEISITVGYPNPLRFSRSFKSVYGIAPREYRQMNFIQADRP